MNSQHGLTVDLRAKWLHELTDMKLKALLLDSNTGLEIVGVNYKPGGVHIGPSSVKVREGVVSWSPDSDIVFENLTVKNSFNAILIYSPSTHVSVHTFGDQTVERENFILRIPSQGLIRITNKYK